jgi:two-component system, LytTR family, sensor kinase
MAGRDVGVIMTFGGARTVFAIFVICSFIGLLSFSTFLTADRLDGRETPALVFLINELTGAYSFFPLALLAIFFTRRFLLTRRTWARFVPLHLAASVVVGLLHTTLMTLSRSRLYPLFGLGPYDPGNLLYRYLLEYQKQLLIYAAIVAAVHIVSLYRARRSQQQRTSELEVKAAQLQSRLAETQLQMLRTQLQPHFLFNTLNMISSTMYEDAETADRMITRLGHLLRVSLEQADRPVIRLEEEIQALEAYLDIMRTRFSDRLRFSVEMAPRLASALLPGFLLQPLVENAIKYADESSGNPLEIRVRVRECEPSRLEISIIDNGPGLEPGTSVAEGYGLSSTRSRLNQMYGDRAGLRYEAGEQGFRVSIRLPLELELPVATGRIEVG